MVTLPRIALVGRPNVGKSTLFNRICGRRKAIIDSRPGSTRDRNYAQTAWQGAAFELIDTGGLLLGSADPLLGPAAEQAQRAIDEADLVLFMVDARAGLLPDDSAIAASLRRKGKKVVVAVNKVEGPEDASVEFARLGFPTMLSVSAEHGLGVGDLLDAALAELPRVAVPEDEAAPLRIAIVGRPNVSKSSLLNRFLGRSGRSCRRSRDHARRRGQPPGAQGQALPLRGHGRDPPSVTSARTSTTSASCRPGAQPRAGRRGPLVLTPSKG